MMITAMVLTPVLIIHGVIMNRIDRLSNAYDCVLLAKNIINEAHQKQQPEAQTFSLEKNEGDFDAKVTYSLAQAVDPKSSLKSLEGLHPERVTVAWTDRGEKKQMKLAAFVYKKPEQKK